MGQDLGPGTQGSDIGGFCRKRGIDIHQGCVDLAIQQMILGQTQPRVDVGRLRLDSPRQVLEGQPLLTIGLVRSCQQQQYFRRIRLVFQHGAKGTDGLGILLFLHLQAPLQHQCTAVLWIFSQDFFQEGFRLIVLARLCTQCRHSHTRPEAMRFGAILLDQPLVDRLGLVQLVCLCIQTGQGKLQVRHIRP